MTLATLNGKAVLYMDGEEMREEVKKKILEDYDYDDIAEDSNEGNDQNRLNNKISKPFAEEEDEDESKAETIYHNEFLKWVKIPAEVGVIGVKVTSISNEGEASYPKFVSWSSNDVLLSDSRWTCATKTPKNLDWTKKNFVEKYFDYPQIWDTEEIFKNTYFLGIPKEVNWIKSPLRGSLFCRLEIQGLKKSTLFF